MDYHLIATFGTSSPYVKVAHSLADALVLAEEAVEKGASLKVSYVEKGKGDHKTHRVVAGHMFLSMNGVSA